MSMFESMEQQYLFRYCVDIVIMKAAKTAAEVPCDDLCCVDIAYRSSLRRGNYPSKSLSITSMR